MAFIQRAPLLRCLPLVIVCILTPTLIQTIHQDAMFTPPMKCQYDVEQNKADCHFQGFDSIPQNLPNNIKELDVRLNNITFILSSSFKRYPLIQVLDLSSNDIRVIESASFYPLKDLNRLILNGNPNLVLPATDLFRWSKNLSILDLSFCYLKLLPNDTLKWSPSVESLYLGFNKLTFVNMSLCGRAKNVRLVGNKIKHLTAESFIFGCQSYYVDLRANPIKSVDPNVIASLHVRSLVLGYYPLTLKDTFSGICRSEIVELALFITDINITVLPRDFFGHLRNCSLSVLRLAGNKIQFLSPYVFSNLTRLVELDLSVNKVQSLSPYVFSNLTRLVELDLSCNKIQSLSPYVFSNLTRLVELDLSYNKIQSLSQYVFSNLTRLVELHLSYNEIVTVEPVFFQGMRELKVLNLKKNRIKYINPNTDVWALDLNELYLRGNSLTTLSEFAFFGLRNLTLLDLSFNRDLIVLEITSSSELTGIQTINLNYCLISRFQPVAPNLTTLHLNNNDNPMVCPIHRISFKDSQELVDLEIRESGLSTNDLWDILLNVSIFDGLSNLIILDLSFNYFNILDNFPARIFEQLSALQKLSLEACRISGLHPLAFMGLESLRVLNLRGNTIQQLNFDIFKVLELVTIINLDDNRLAYLDEQLFSNNPRLTTLLLSNNRLTRLNQTTFEPIESLLLSFDLSLNPIVCNCDLRWFRDLVRHIDVINENRTVCSSASLEPLRRKPLLDFDPNKLCGLNIVLVTLTPLAGIFLVVIVVVLYHNRWPLKYKLFLLKLMVIGYKEMRDARNHNDYEFDLNIIFYDDDEEWVRQQLQPALEERLPQFQKNVFGDQDLILGMHYLDAVDYVVSHSYKTIILLSRAAVHDRWFMLKLRTAMDHVSDTETEFVVVVFLEDFPDEDIPFLARLYLSDGRPYQHWTEDVRGHDFFWNALVKNLTINLRTNDFIPNE
ncbi:toll-like receptor 3 [Strongylocentrotus purpuratus]|uniref:TIR domain-containing protein n=1 Tax=Strongylocentrotus purpuratus TaxID=7668 RepID=A0A7M7P6G9_STRPU|nr:toll-like receptor 3 [Strongylocentrotus purpuratus]